MQKLSDIVTGKIKKLLPAPVQASGEQLGASETA